MALDGERWNAGRPRAGGNHDVLEAELLVLDLRSAHAQRVGVDKLGRALEVAYVALLCQLSQAAGEFLDHIALPGPQGLQLNVLMGALDSPIAGVSRLVNDLGDVQQRLGGDAAYIQAHSARIGLTVNKRDLHAHVGGEERGSVATGPRADDCDVFLMVRHRREQLAFRQSAPSKALLAKR